MRRGLLGALVSGAAFCAIAATAHAAAPPPAGAVLSPDGKRAAWVGDGGQERLERDAREPGGGVARPGAAAGDPRDRRQARLLAGQQAAGVREPARRPRLHRGLRPQGEQDRLRRPVVRRRQRAELVGGRHARCRSCAPTAGRPCRSRRRCRRSAPWAQPPVRTNDVFKVADILQAPISYGPEASGDGRSVAYITREATARAIYFMRSGTPSRRVVNYPDDDGRELSQLAVSQRRRRDRLRARQLAQQRRRDPQPGLGRRHAAPARLRRPVARRGAADARRRPRAGVHAGRQDARLDQRHDAS